MQVKLLDPPRTSIDRRVLLVGAFGGMSSGIALVVSILTEAPLWMSSTFVFVPGFLALAALGAVLRGRQQELYLSRVRSGAVAGLLGTAAYDVTRFVAETSGLASTNTFKAIPLFGAGLTNQSPHEPLAIVMGWAFHLCNGIGFALAYTLVAAGRPAYLGVLFALSLEMAMVLLYPQWLGITLTKEFLSVSVLGHVAYGVVLGRSAERTT